MPPRSEPPRKSLSRLASRSHANSESESSRQQQVIRDQAQLLLENIYANIDSLWRQAREFPGTFKLLDLASFEPPSSDAYHRCLLAQDILRDALFMVVIRTSTFLGIIKGVIQLSNDAFQELLSLILEHKTSVGQFASSRNVGWFHGSKRSDLEIPANWFCPQIDHPHEVYRANDGTLQRSLFQDDYGTHYKMFNISENQFDEALWQFNNLPRPSNWPEWQRFPGDPSVCPPKGHGPLALCHGSCGKRTGDSTSGCTCVADKTYNHALVEIVQLPSEQLGALNRGVVTVTRIKGGDYIGEYCGVYIPFDFNDIPLFGDSKYSFEWEPTPKFHRTSGHIVDDKSLDDEDPIATLIAGKFGSWPKFLNHTKDGTHNVEFVFVPIAGKMRIVAQAVRDIRAGEELVTTYGDLHFARRSPRLQKREREFRKIQGLGGLAKGK